MIDNGAFSEHGRIHPKSQARKREGRIAARVFELSQTAKQQWLSDDYEAMRRILEIMGLSCTLDDSTPVPTTSIAYDVLAEGLLSESNRDNWI